MEPPSSALTRGGSTSHYQGDTLLVPFAQGFCHVRNRVYVPQFGRWLQRDPNASGLAVMDSLAFHGGTQAAAALAVDMEQMYGDGMSLYAYLGGNPWERSDPTGLFVEPGFNPLDLNNQFDPPFDIFAATDVQGMVTTMLQSLVEHYAANLDADVEWAVDWDLTDDSHSRNSDKWVTLAILEGLSTHFNLALDDFVDEEEVDDGGPTFAGRERRGPNGGKSKLIGVSRELYKHRRLEFKANKSRYWQQELKANPKAYTPKQHREIRNGNAPIGKDGHPMEIHHKQQLSQGGRNERTNFKFLTRTDHRLGKSNRKNHPKPRRTRRAQERYRRRDIENAKPFICHCARRNNKGRNTSCIASTQGSTTQ